MNKNPITSLKSQLTKGAFTAVGTGAFQQKGIMRSSLENEKTDREKKKLIEQQEELVKN